jgi:hypothetical protein
MEDHDPLAAGFPVDEMLQLPLMFVLEFLRLKRNGQLLDQITPVLEFLLGERYVRKVECGAGNDFIGKAEGMETEELPVRPQGAQIRPLPHGQSDRPSWVCLKRGGEISEKRRSWNQEERPTRCMRRYESPPPRTVLSHPGTGCGCRWSKVMRGSGEDGKDNVYHPDG